jgi:hypothetical protein
MLTGSVKKKKVLTGSVKKKKVLTGARVVGLEKMEREKRLHMLVNEYLRVYCNAGEKGQEVYLCIYVYICNIYR